MSDPTNNMRNVGLILVGLNLGLAVLKTLTWIHTDSLSILSEAANSWIDTVYSLLILVGIYISTKDPTDEYPEGYRRIEPFVAILIGIGIILTSLLIGYNSIQNIIHEDTEVSYELTAIIVLLISGLTKYIMYRYCLKVYNRTNSPILAAVGIDNRNDILTILIALIGIGGSIANIHQIDVYAALIIAIGILYSGLTILKENAEYVLARSAPDETINELKESILRLDDVHGIHDVRVHYSGPQIDITMHLEVSGGLTIEKGHEIEQEAITKIKNTCDKPINEINLHIDPESLEEWQSN